MASPDSHTRRPSSVTGERLGRQLAGVTLYSVCSRRSADTGSLPWLLSRQKAIRGPSVTIYWLQTTPRTPETTQTNAVRPAVSSHSDLATSQSDCPAGGFSLVFVIFFAVERAVHRGYNPIVELFFCSSLNFWYSIFKRPESVSSVTVKYPPCSYYA